MRLQQLLGTELPIIQAPMAGVQGSALAAAVSNAGGLGSLPAAMLDAAGLRRELAALKAASRRRRRWRKRAGSKPLGTFALLPQIVRAVRVPVIAAGGIADARGVAAALALGAAGVQVGTAYMLCPEATTSALHRAALRRLRDAAGAEGGGLLDGDAGPPPHTALTNVFSGRPARGIVNRVMREMGPISAAAPAFPLATAAIAPMRAWAEARGSGDFSPLWSGQNASGCSELPAAELTRALAAGLAAPA